MKIASAPPWSPRAYASSVELSALGAWTFGAQQAARLDRLVLSVVGSDTQPVWVEVAAFLHSTLPQVDECTIDGAGHLLQIQRPAPVARAMAKFLDRHPIGGDRPEALKRPSRSPGTATVPQQASVAFRDA